MCMSVPNMKFLRLILWLGEVCIDADNADDNDSDAVRRIKHDSIGFFGGMPNEPKKKSLTENKIE